jgi:AcrR family transcriptional regulator
LLFTKILEYAIKLIDYKSFDATTTYEIAREAAVTGPLIYCHFKGKDELLDTVVFTQLSGDADWLV